MKVTCRPSNYGIRTLLQVNKVGIFIASPWAIGYRYKLKSLEHLETLELVKTYAPIEGSGLLLGFITDKGVDYLKSMFPELLTNPTILGEKTIYYLSPLLIKGDKVYLQEGSPSLNPAGEYIINRIYKSSCSCTSVEKEYKDRDFGFNFYVEGSLMKLVFPQPIDFNVEWGKRFPQIVVKQTLKKVKEKRIIENNLIVMRIVGMLNESGVRDRIV